MKEIKLNPCPICGSTEHISVLPQKIYTRVKKDQSEGGNVHIMCDQCDVCVTSYGFLLVREGKKNTYNNLLRECERKWNLLGGAKNEEN